jgi:membrane-bound lytic murein transglycosylase D
MGEAQLRELNNIPKGMLIKPGSTLLVTRSAHGEFDVSEAVADRGEVGFAPEIVRVRKTVRAAKGDSVATIAKRYGTTPSNVAQWNKVAANASFKAGQSVVVFVSGSTTKAKATSKARASSKAKKRTTAKKPRAGSSAKKSKA